MRVGALIRRELGNDALDRWYAAVGHAFFFDGREDARARGARARSSRGAGFDATFVDRAIADESTLDRGARRAPRRGRALRRPRRADARLRRRLRRVRPGRRARARRAPTRSRSGSSCARCNGSRTCTSCATRRRIDDLVHVGGAVPHVPHDARLADGREPRAVTRCRSRASSSGGPCAENAGQASSRRRATGTTCCSPRGRPSSRRRRATRRARPDRARPGTRRPRGTRALGRGRHRDELAPRLVDLRGLEPRTAARLHRELVDLGALGEALIGRDHNELPVGAPRTRR